MLTEAEVTLLSDRRRNGPWGLSGGADGFARETHLWSGGRFDRKIGGQINVRLRRANGFGVETPALADGETQKSASLKQQEA